MDLPTYDELEKNPSALHVQQSRPAVQHSNINGFGSTANSNQQQQQYQHQTRPQNQQQFQFQYPQQQQQQQQGRQPMATLETGQIWNSNPSWNLSPSHKNRQPRPSPVLQMLTLGAIVIKLVYAGFVVSWFIKEWVGWENEIKAMNDRPRFRHSWERNVEAHPEVKMVRRFWALGFGFGFLHIALLITAFVGGIKKNLYLVLVWIVLLSLDIILQFFVMAASSIVFDLFLNIKSYQDERSKPPKYLIFLLVQSVLFLIFNLLCLTCALMWCRQLNLEKFRCRQAKIMACQGGPKSIYSS